MASAGTVTVEFAAETAKFTDELKKLRTQLGQMQQSLNTLDKAARVAFRFFTAGALLSFTKSAFAAADATADLAEQHGLAVETFSRLQFAAGQTDVEISSLTSGINKYQVTLSKAQTANKQAQESFARYNLEAEKLSKLALEDQLGEIAERFRAITDEEDRTRFAVEFFGKAAGPQLKLLLNQGRDGIRELMQEADRLGITLRGPTAEAIGEADKALKRLIATSKGAAAGVIGLLAVTLSPPKTQQGQLAVQIAQLSAEIRLLERDIASGPETGIFDRLLGTDVASDIENLRKAKDELAALRLQLSGIRGETAAGQLNNLLPLPWLDRLQLIDIEPIKAMKITVDELAIAFDNLDESIKEIQQARVTDALQISSDDVALLQRDLQQKITDDLAAELQRRHEIEEFHRTTRFAAEVASETAIQQLKAQTFSNVIGALQAFAGQSKKAAIAAIAIQKAQALAQAIQYGHVAIMAAAASAPPPGNAAAIAWAKGFMALNIAAIAATGLGQIRSIQSGGAPPGSPANPIFTNSDGAADEQSFGASPQRVATVHFNGPFMNNRESRDQIKQWIEELTDADVIVISPNSLNGQQLMSAG